MMFFLSARWNHLDSDFGWFASSPDLFRLSETELNLLMPIENRPYRDSITCATWRWLRPSHPSIRAEGRGSFIFYFMVALTPRKTFPRSLSTPLQKEIPPNHT